MGSIMTGAEPGGIQIHLEDVERAHGGEPAVAGVSLDVHAGEYLCILGPNGSGKSTLLSLMNALAAPTAGTMRVLGLDPARGEEALAIRRQVAMVFQHPEDQMVTSVVADDVAFGPENLGLPREEIARRVEAALAATGLAELAQADPADLSGGQKQRVAIAGALAMEPKILLLDEPTAMLDAQGRCELMDIVDGLNARGITVVHVTHFMDEALRAHRCVAMRAGRVAADGAPAEVLLDTGLIHELGLEEPFAVQLSRELVARGMDLPLTTDPHELARSVAAELGRLGNRDGQHAVARDTVTAPAGDAAPFASLDRVSYSYASAANARKRTRKRTRVSIPAGPLALDGVSLDLPRGTCTALVGRTGSGKSTTSELLCALKVPAAGTVTVGGVDTADLARRRQLRAQVGYVSQLPERQLFAQTVLEDVSFGPRNLDLSEDEALRRVKGALAAVGLDPTEELLARSPFALSGGQQRGVALAGILAMGQPLLVLDEPMAGLDPRGRERLRGILARLRSRGTTLLVVTHSMDDAAALADRVVALDHGRKVADGTPREVFGEHGGILPGLPAPLAFARELAELGHAAPLARTPLTVDALADSIAPKEVAAHGAAR